MMNTIDQYRERVTGTNIDPRSLLSTDYFNHFNTVIMLLGMLPDMPELLDEIDAWQFITYKQHFEASGLDFAPLAIEVYDHVPPKLLKAFERKLDQISLFVDTTRLALRQLHEKGDTDRFAEMALRASRDMQTMIDEGGAIVHGSEASMDQDDVNALFS